jgi:hypothetical protein
MGEKRRGPPRLAEQDLPWIHHLRSAYQAGQELGDIMVECVKLGMPPRTITALQKVIFRLRIKRPEGFIANTKGSEPRPLSSWEEILRTMYEANAHIDAILQEVQLHGAPDYVDKNHLYKLIDARRWRRGDEPRKPNGGRPPRPLVEWESRFREMYTTGMDINSIVIEVRKLGSPPDMNADRLRKKAATHGWKRPPGFFVTNRANQTLRQKLIGNRVAESVNVSNHTRLLSVYSRRSEIIRRVPVGEGELPRMYGTTSFVPTLPPEPAQEPPPQSLELPPPGPDGVIAAHFLVIKKYADDRNYHFDGSNVEQLNRDLRRGLPPIIMRA